MDDLKQKILNDILQTGFTAELHVGSKLIRHGWTVLHGASYYDQTFGKSRELDIVARMSEGNDKLDYHLIFHLVIQVKTSKRPWVIFSSPVVEERIGWQLVHACLNFIPSIHLPFHQVSQGIMREGHERIGTAFHEAFKSPSEPSQVYEALVSCCKAADSLRSEYLIGSETSDDEEIEFYPNGMHILHMFLPVVVLRGQLFEAYLDEDGEVQLEEKTYIPIYFSHSHQSRENSQYPISHSFYPDVVTEQGLEDYLALVNRWRVAMFSSACEYLGRDMETR